MSPIKLLLNDLKIIKRYELHVSKKEALERLEELLEKNFYRGKLGSESFKLYPSFLSVRFRDYRRINIFGQFNEVESSIELEIIIKRSFLFKLGALFLDIILFLIGIMMSFSDQSFKPVLIFFVILTLVLVVVTRLYNAEYIYSSEEDFMEYLSYLFKPWELKLMK
jgi:hypothetical protein